MHREQMNVTDSPAARQKETSLPGAETMVSEDGLALRKSGNAFHVVRRTSQRRRAGLWFLILATLAAVALILFIAFEPSAVTVGIFVTIAAALLAFVGVFYSFAFYNVDLKGRAVVIVPTDSDVVELPGHAVKLQRSSVSHLSESHLADQGGESKVQLALHARGEGKQSQEFVLARVAEPSSQASRLRQIATRLAGLLDCELTTA